MIVTNLKAVWLLKQVLGTSQWPLERLRQRQEEKLRRLRVHAYHHVPLYRILYDEASFNPEVFHSPEDLIKIPVLSKKRLKGAGSKEAVARDIGLIDVSW